MTGPARVRRGLVRLGQMALLLAGTCSSPQVQTKGSPGGGAPGGNSGGGPGWMVPAPGDGGGSSPGAMPVPAHMPRRDYPCPGCAAFPAPGTAACAPTSLPPPKVVYPPDGTLLPPNMNVLEVQWIPGAGASLFQVELHNAATSITVATKCNPVPDVRGGASRGCGLTLEPQAWNDVAYSNRGGEAVQVTVRATGDGSCVASSADEVAILFAEEDLRGGIYYWQSDTFGGVSGTTGGIFSHDFGSRDVSARPFLATSPNGTCVGCHNVSRDGARMAVGIDDPDADDEMGDIDTHVVDVMTGKAIDGTNLLKKKTGWISPGFQTFTRDHTKLIASSWRDGGNRHFSVIDGDGKKLLAKMPVGMGLAATQPDLSPDDRTLAYVVPQAGTISVDAGDHHFLHGSLYAASFDAAANTLGPPQVVLAAGADQSFYYPSFAPTGDFLVFNAVAMAGPSDGSFYNRRARVALLPYPPGTQPAPIELPALNGIGLGDRLTNSWPKWSPFVQRYKGSKLLWVTFSSNRDYGLHFTNNGFDNCYPPESPAYLQPQSSEKQPITKCAHPQIWMAAILVDAVGGGMALGRADRSFPAFWLPVQDVKTHNHTAQWVEKVVSMGDGRIVE